MECKISSSFSEMVEQWVSYLNHPVTFYQSKKNIKMKMNHDTGRVIGVGLEQGPIVFTGIINVEYKEFTVIQGHKKAI